MSDLDVKYTTVDRLKIRYAESNPDSGADRQVVLFSPWPESLYAFLPIWHRLAGHAHLFAVDLPGFGGSEGRIDLLSPRSMAEWIHSFIGSLGLRRPHLVGPDISTSALLFTALHHPDSVATITVGSGGAEYPVNITSTLKDIVRAENLEAFASMDARDIVGSTLDAALAHRLPADVRADYLASYAGNRFVESCAYVRAYPTDLKILAPSLSDINAPTLIIAGRQDPFVPVSNAEYLHRRLPNSRLEVFDCGHFTWEDAAHEYARAVLDWTSS